MSAARLHRPLNGRGGHVYCENDRETWPCKSIMLARINEDGTRIARIRCSHREGLAYELGGAFGCAPCDCNEPVEVLTRYIVRSELQP